MYQLASPISSHENFLLRNWLYQDLTYVSISGYKYNSAEGPRNKLQFCNLTERMNIVRRCRTDSVAYLLYQAMLCNNNGRYNRALRLVQQSKEKISDSSSIYWHKFTPDLEHCREVGLDRLPIKTVLKRHFIHIIILETDQYIPQLYLEMYRPDTNTGIIISPLICAFFLQYLCQRKLRQLIEADDTLYELSLFVKHDDGHHIDIHNKAICWQVLGICQQMRGHDRSACQSFFTAQRHSGGKEMFKVATSIRLGFILLKYF